MPTTSNRGYAYPLGAATPNVPYDLQQLAEDVDVDLEAVDTRLTTAEGEIDTLQTEMNTAEADIAALEASAVTGWTALTIHPDWSGSAFRTLRAGHVSVRGELYDGLTHQDVFTLPAGYRPVARFSIKLVRFGSSTVDAHMHFDTDGTVELQCDSIPTVSPGFAFSVTFPKA